jgi:hypothetical protein
MFLTEVRLTRRIGRILRRLRVSPVIDTLDRWLARYRKHLGRFVPDGAAPMRYP